MIVIKWLLLILIFGGSSYLGLAMANKYKYRVKDLKVIRSILNVIETKIKYTYQPLPQIFDDISKEFEGAVGEIFLISKEKMREISVGEAWRYAIDNSSTYMNEEDLNILKNLEKLLGKTNVEGQLSELDLTEKFIDTQIKKAEEEQRKNEKLYRNLGVTIGLAIVIILI